MSNYSATVVKIKELRPHSNADRLVCTNIFGNNVIVGKETKVGDMGLFFPLESQIGLEFAIVNDLIRRKDENGKPVGGMFDENRRVRCQTFRGEKSMGFFIPIESLNNLFSNGKALDTFEEGQEIEEYLGKTISQKYVPKFYQTPGQGIGPKKARQPRVSRIIPGQFNFHTDTAQLGKNIHKVKPEDLIVLTWKLHGTSAIASNCLVNRKLGIIEKFLNKIGYRINSQYYDYIYASRRVIKNEFEESKQHFYGHDLWSEIGKEHFEGKLHTGETVYYEIVGYTKDYKFIQKGYDYGCVQMPHNDKPQHKIFVYRITRTGADGTVTELQWNQVKERCSILGVNTVPEIYYGIAAKLQTFNKLVCHNEVTDTWCDDYLAYLKMTYVYDQDCQFCSNKVPAEGIVLRKEGLTIEAFKLKSFRFLEHETKELDTNVENIEDHHGA
jgi:hypothetical protein